jgi:methionine synthase II (cobalamin-independent)
MDKLEITANARENSEKINARKIINAGLAGLTAGTFTFCEMFGDFGDIIGEEFHTEGYYNAKKNLKPKKIIADMKNRYHLIYEYFKNEV